MRRNNMSVWSWQQLTCCSRRADRRVSCCGAGWARLVRSRPCRCRTDSGPAASAAPWVWTAAWGPKTPWRFLMKRIKKHEFSNRKPDKLNHFWTSFVLTCLEEVPLGVILSIIALLWREEETHSTHLAPPTHTHTQQDKQPALKVLASALLSWVVSATWCVWFMLEIIVCSTYQIVFEQSQPHAVRLHALPAAKPLRSVVVDKTSRLQAAENQRC